MNGHVRSKNVGYDGMHGTYGFGLELGMQMATGLWSLQMW